MKMESWVAENIDMVQLSDREIGRFESTLAQLEHRARNDRQALFLIEDVVSELRRELDKMKARLYTAVSIAIVLGPAVAWLIDVIV